MIDDQASIIITALFASLGGYVEAIGYSKLFGLFIGPMSGNTVVLATSGGAGQGGIAGTRAATIAVFVFGVFLAVSMRNCLKRIEFHYFNVVLFLVEAFGLLLFFLFDRLIIDHSTESATGPSFYLLMPPAVLAMAIQSGKKYVLQYIFIIFIIKLMLSRRN